MDILLWNAKRLRLNLLKGSLEGFLGKLVQVKGYITIKTIFRVEENAK